MPFEEFLGIWVCKQQLCRPWAQVFLPGHPSLGTSKMNIKFQAVKTFCS